MSGKSAGIRETVRVLLALLADCGCPHVPSESFRLGKFDKPEAAEPFWRALHHVTSLHLFLGSGDLRDLREAVATGENCWKSSDIKHISLSVRRRAVELGYTRPQFYVEGVGSRELLLFFAWLLRAESLVSRLQTYHVRAALQSTSVPLSSSNQFLLENIEGHTTSLKGELETLVSQKLPLEEALRKVQWLKGTLMGRGRSVENSHRAAARLSHSTTQPSSSSSSTLPTGSSAPQAKVVHRLSLHDLFLLRYPEQLAVCVGRLEWHVVCLEGLGRWGQLEPVFWQWMESVLDQLSPSSPSPESDREDSTAVVEMREDQLKEEMYKCQQELSDAIGDCLLKVGAGRRQSSHKSKEQVNKTRHDLCLGLQPVAVESGVFCPAVAQPRQPPAGGGECSQLRMVEGELRRLGTRLLEDEETLLSIRTTITAYIM